MLTGTPLHHRGRAGRGDPPVGSCPWPGCPPPGRLPALGQVAAPRAGCPASATLPTFGQLPHPWPRYPPLATLPILGQVARPRCPAPARRRQATARDRPWHRGDDGPAAPILPQGCYDVLSLGAHRIAHPAPRRGTAHPAGRRRGIAHPTGPRRGVAHPAGPPPGNRAPGRRQLQTTLVDSPGRRPWSAARADPLDPAAAWPARPPWDHEPAATSPNKRRNVAKQQGTTPVLPQRVVARGALRHNGRGGRRFGVAQGMSRRRSPGAAGLRCRAGPTRPHPVGTGWSRGFAAALPPPARSRHPSAHVGSVNPSRCGLAADRHVPASPGVG